MVYSEMKEGWKHIIEGLYTIAWFAFLGALIQTLRTKKTSLIHILIEFLTAITSGILFGLLVRKAGLSEFYTYSVVSAISLFSSKLLPIIENLVAKWVTKKGNDVVQNSDNG